MRVGAMMVRISRRLNFIKVSDEQLRIMAACMEGQCDILAFYLFGSYGTKQQTLLSDIDFAVLPMPGETLDVWRELDLLGELQQISEEDDTNLVNLSRAPVTLQMKVLAGGRLLYCRDPVLLADFKEHVIRRYCDFAPHLQEFYRDYDAGLKEELL